MSHLFEYLFAKRFEDGDARCLFIAPYSPAESATPAFGAAKKIRLACDGLRQNKIQVLFLNTANNVVRKQFFKKEYHFPANVIPCNFFSNIWPRPLGRLLYIFISPFLGLLLGLLIKPKIIWVYNLGAGEMLAGYFAGIFAKVKILEVEDMPFSRGRGIGELKPRLDHFISRVLKNQFNTYLYVSESVRKELGVRRGYSLIIPGIISKMKVHRPVGNDLKKTAGFFGGFDKDKGADLLIDLLKNRDRDWRYIICGGGSESIISGAVQTDLGDRLFLRENDIIIEGLQNECHIFLNPHRPLAEMKLGVFPFKIAEYLNGQAMILTTSLGIPVEDLKELGIETVAWRAVDFHDKIKKSLSRMTYIDSNVLKKREEFLSSLIAKRLVYRIINGETESKF